MEASCIQILSQSLEKKCQVLDRMIELNKSEETLLGKDEFDMDALDAVVDEQNQSIAELEKLDNGFEALYERIREGLADNKERYRNEIAHMQELIQKITDMVATVNAGRMRNKMLAENRFKKERSSLHGKISQSRVARGYYNSMNNLNYVQPQFYDNKK
jgi:flagellar biosynthesis/type III secretory pathway chaperone